MLPCVIRLNGNRRFLNGKYSGLPVRQLIIRVVQGCRFRPIGSGCLLRALHACYLTAISIAKGTAVHSHGGDFFGSVISKHRGSPCKRHRFRRNRNGSGAGLCLIIFACYLIIYGVGSRVAIRNRSTLPGRVLRSPIRNLRVCRLSHRHGNAMLLSIIGSAVILSRQRHPLFRNGKFLCIHRLCMAVILRHRNTYHVGSIILRGLFCVGAVIRALHLVYNRYVGVICTPLVVGGNTRLADRSAIVYLRLFAKNGYNALRSADHNRNRRIRRLLTLGSILPGMAVGVVRCGQGMGSVCQGLQVSCCQNQVFLSVYLFYLISSRCYILCSFFYRSNRILRHPDSGILIRCGRLYEVHFSGGCGVCVNYHAVGIQNGNVPGVIGDFEVKNPAGIGRYGKTV